MKNSILAISLVYLITCFMNTAIAQTTKGGLPCIDATCCFEIWYVPKGIADTCHQECEGELDNVFELHFKPCDSNNIPDGNYAIINLRLNSPATIGNCATCSDPNKFEEGPLPGNSINIAICSPYCHSFSFDVKIWNDFGDTIMCLDLYDNFCVDDECNTGPGPGPGIWQEGNDHSKNETVEIREGIHREENNKVLLYPNPSQDLINVYSDESIKSYSIYSIKGEELRQSIEFKNDVLNLKNLTSGFYIVELNLDNGSQIKRKIFKE